MASALIRRALTTSPSTRAAPTVAKSGAVKLKAVTSASGIMVSAVKPATKPMTLIPARKPLRPMRLVLSAEGPWRKSQGSIIARARKLRKKTTSKGSSSAVESRTLPLIVAKKAIAASM